MTDPKIVATPSILRPYIATTADAEAAVDAACKPLLDAGLIPTRLLMSVAMFDLLRTSDRVLPPTLHPFHKRAYQAGHGHSAMLVTVTSSNPGTPFVTAYAE